MIMLLRIKKCTHIATFILSHLLASLLQTMLKNKQTTMQNWWLDY